MGNTSFRLVPKIEGNKIGIFLVAPSMRQSRQVAYLEVPDDCQLNDNMELANEVCTAYRKRLRKSI